MQVWTLFFPFLVVNVIRRLVLRAVPAQVWSRFFSQPLIEYVLSYIYLMLFRSFAKLGISYARPFPSSTFGKQRPAKDNGSGERDLRRSSSSGPQLWSGQRGCSSVYSGVEETSGIRGRAEGVQKGTKLKRVIGLVELSRPNTASTCFT